MGCLISFALCLVPLAYVIIVMRILCLDIGSKRIGVAATDPMGWTAQPIRVIERRGDKKDFAEIAQTCTELEAEMILVGLPLDAEGQEGAAAAKVKEFSRRMQDALTRSGLDLQIEFWDERNSTATAEERLIEADVSRAKRRRVIDKMAAVAILQDWLASRELESGGDDEGGAG